MAFTCPKCKTVGRWGTGTNEDGTKFYHCNGVLDLPGGGKMSCDWRCPVSAGLEHGLVTVKEVLLQAAHDGSNLSYAVGLLAVNPGENFRKSLADAAEQHEKLAARLRLVASYDLHQEQERERARGEQGKEG